MQYENTLYKIIDHIPEGEIHRLNRKKAWDYGYNEKHDVIVISKTGKIGDVMEIQNLKIALPKTEKVHKSKNNKWVRFEYPKELSRIKNVFEWDRYPDNFKDKWLPYIDKEFDRRSYGFWFKNNGVDTYITGSHYMYLQWSKIDVGYPDYRDANRIFFIFWEACKADDRCYGMCYVKNRRSGFSYMAVSEAVNLATITKNSKYGILSKTGKDAKDMFVDKLVPVSSNYPFFFKPIQDGMDKPKTELAYRVPASKLTKKSILKEVDEYELTLEGLDTVIDWKNTGDNSYDGQKLAVLIHDESGKWIRPDNIKNNWKVTKTCLRLGGDIVGKCMMGSTVNPLDNGGENFKGIFEDSDVTRRNSNGQTRSGLYSLFIPMEWNYEGYIDSFGFPAFFTPTEVTTGPTGKEIKIGVIDYWQNEADGLKDKPDDLNEHYRQFPRTVEHAFRDDAKNALYNLQKIYEQIDFNDGIKYSGVVTRGGFHWEDGKQDSRVVFTPDRNGRFFTSWVPPVHMQNRYILKNGMKFPGNDHMGAFGCDSYDITGTVDGRGSKGALHGLTKYSMEDAPPNTFFLEYVARPQTTEVFFEDMIKAIFFYGMPILVENNKPRLLYTLKRRGYRGYSMNRPDKVWNKLSTTEKEIGGIPNTSEDIKQAHSAAIETYIDNYVGMKRDGEYGNMYFNRTLNDWARFDITKRTMFDATISSGLAIMACNRNLYKPVAKRQVVRSGFSFPKYDNRGAQSRIVKRENNT